MFKGIYLRETRNAPVEKPISGRHSGAGFLKKISVAINQHPTGEYREEMSEAQGGAVIRIRGRGQTAREIRGNEKNLNSFSRKQTRSAYAEMREA